jgi:hypothetical protein
MPKTRERMTPLELTQNVLDISATERATFNLCRRRWELEVLENLTPRTPPTFELEFGSGIHSALEAYYLTTSNAVSPPLSRPEVGEVDPVEAALIRWDDWYETTEQEVVTDKSLPSATKDELLDNLVDLADLGEAMIEGYHQFAKLEDQFTIHAIEGRQTGAGRSWLTKHQAEREHLAEHSANAVIRHESGRLLIPILNPKKQQPVKRGPMLSCRLDLLVHRIDDGMRGIWIYDHKTTTGTPNDRNLDFDDQITAYCYAVWRWLGIVPRGVCMNFLIKQAPKEPRLIQKGEVLSTARDQLTTAKKYRAELKRRGLILKDGTISDERPIKGKSSYAEAYEALLSRGWDPFFVRQYAGRNRQELVSFEERLYDEYWDMFDASNGDTHTNPHFSPPYLPWCTFCKVAPICQAIEDDSDVDGIIESRYMQAPDRKAV